MMPTALFVVPLVAIRTMFDVPLDAARTMLHEQCSPCLCTLGPTDIPRVVARENAVNSRLLSTNNLFGVPLLLSPGNVLCIVLTSPEDIVMWSCSRTISFSLFDNGKRVVDVNKNVINRRPIQSYSRI